MISQLRYHSASLIGSLLLFLSLVTIIAGIGLLITGTTAGASLSSGFSIQHWGFIVSGVGLALSFVWDCRIGVSSLIRSRKKIGSAEGLAKAIQNFAAIQENKDPTSQELSKIDLQNNAN